MRGGPGSPKVDQPNTEELLSGCGRWNPDQATRYRQRTGEDNEHTETARLRCDLISLLAALKLAPLPNGRRAGRTPAQTAGDPVFASRSPRGD